MVQIPWKLKSAAFSIFDVVGQKPLYLMQKHLTRRSRIAFKDINPVWKFHRDNLQKIGAQCVIEFGAGKNLAQNLYLQELGLDQILVDLNPMLDFSLVNEAIDRLAQMGIAIEEHVSSREELEARYLITYSAPVDMQKTSLKDDTLDACISTNTLEHIPKDTIAGIWKETYRILRSGGIVSAKIDYSDHYAHTDSSLSWLNYLIFKEDTWRRYNHDCHFQNRLRHGHHLKLLSDAGFEIVSESAQNPVSPADLPIRDENLAGDERDFHTAGFIVARKP